ncbi:MAG: 2-dehydro-3-deoxygalactonokinase [Paracoccaceae bacterium]|nr:2-dehydro-3-deoxygalactonokinase [Paracoccaceae bacterium]
MNEINRIYGDWVAVDWGTSNLRYWVMHSNEVIHSGFSSLGMKNLNQDSYETILVNELNSFLNPSKTTTVLICGMAGSRQGWKEAPYLSVPCKPPEWNDAVTVECQDSRMSVRILPGLKQPNPADVIRGEETQIKGFLAKDKNFDGIICLPGTHTKWVRLSAGEIVNFQTFMTGELFALLSQQSVLKHSVSKVGWDERIFKTAVNEIMCDNKLLATKLFSLRGESILNNLSDFEARVRLSGYLIGLELSGSRPYWLGETVCVLGQDEIAMAYETGLKSQGVLVSRNSNQDISLDGLKSIYNWQKGMN